MSALPQLSPDIEDELEDDDVLVEYRRLRKAQLERKYPKPTEADILGMYDDLKTAFGEFHERIDHDRDVRYLKDKMPEKWQKNHQDERRFYSRLSNNEILRVKAMQISNLPKVFVPPAGGTNKARERAAKQTRWAKQLLPAFERKAKRLIRAEVKDGQAGDGLGIYELYLTDSYDGLDLEQREDERPAQYMKRTEQQMIQAGMPMGLRKVDPRSCYFDTDDDGVCYAFIAENKSKRRVMSALQKSSPKKLDELSNPRPGDTGMPTGAASSDGVHDTVETLRYYDHVWYAYIVEGDIVDGPRPHGLPRIPIFLMPGIVTGSPNLSERYQGITWGMANQEVILNDLLTQEWDSAITYGRPKAVVTTPIDGRLAMVNEKPAVLNLSDPGVPQLEPGQKLEDAYAGWQPHDTTHIQNMTLQLYQRSGLNPIAQGESPGADPAGYTVNTLQSSAQKLYQILLENEARCWEEVCDCVRLAIRDTIRDKVWLSAPMADSRAGGTEWLALAPDDIDETPCEVTIPDDTNRLSTRQSLQQANKEGYVPRRIVQEEGFGAEDPEAWDDEMVIDAAEQQLAAQAIEEAKAAIFMRSQQQQMGSGLVDQYGQPMPPSGAVQGANPAPPQPPSVGAGFGQTRAGPADMSASRAQAGQGTSYAPPQRGPT